MFSYNKSKNKNSHILFFVSLNFFENKNSGCQDIAMWLLERSEFFFFFGPFNSLPGASP